MIWEHIKGFNERENWGSPHRMNGLLLMLLSATREQFQRQDPDALFIIHAGFATEGHSEKSQHYVGNAVDFHIETKMSFREQISTMKGILKELQVAHVVGLGLYPTWGHPGFHLDVRGTQARWGRIEDRYVSDTAAIEYAEKRDV